MTAAAAASATSPASAVPFLRLAGLRKTYPGVVALADFSLDVRPGEIIGVVGENGAGKSTVGKIAGGYYSRSSGELEIFGDKVGSWDITTAYVWNFDQVQRAE